MNYGAAMSPVRKKKKRGEGERGKGKKGKGRERGRKGGGRKKKKRRKGKGEGGEGRKKKKEEKKKREKTQGGCRGVPEAGPPGRRGAPARLAARKRFILFADARPKANMREVRKKTKNGQNK